MTFIPAPLDRARRIEVSNATINVYDLGEVEATPIVFLHGAGPGCTGWLDWHPVGERLGDAYRRIYVDLPQYGDSSADPIEGPQYATYAGFVRELLDALELGSAHFICQSYGGSVALRLAFDEPERFVSLTLTGTPAPYGVISPSPLARVAGQVLAPYYDGGPTLEKLRTLIEQVEWVDPEAIPDGLVEARFSKCSSPEHLALREIKNVRGIPEDLGPDLGRNTVPTLLAYGDRDPFCPAEIPLNLFSRFPDARAIIFKNGSHHFPEELPEDYVTMVRPWLSECEARRKVPL